MAWYSITNVEAARLRHLYRNDVCVCGHVRAQHYEYPEGRTVGCHVSLCNCTAYAWSHLDPPATLDR